LTVLDLALTYIIYYHCSSLYAHFSNLCTHCTETGTVQHHI